MPTVYILTNAAMPGIVKIGLTDGPVETRMRQLDTTGVPLPFEAFLAVEVQDAIGWERALHEAFGDHRVRAAREFFRISPDKPAAILKMLAGQVAAQDVTPKEDVVQEPGDQEALNKARSRKVNFSFDQASIPIGATLQSVFDDNITSTVIGNKKVLFRGEEHSLSSSALVIAREKGFQWSAIAGPAYWKFDDKPLTELRDALNGEDEE
jgi:hypothetical protein